MCINLFLDSVCDKIVFIDSDLKFEDDAILKLVQYNKDIITGVYPYKKTTLEFPTTLDFSRDNNCKEEETGLVYATRVPTGMMCIKRSVFEQMIDHYNIAKDERDILQFFKTGIAFKDDPNWYGEDTYFCKLWTDMGGLIFINPNMNFSHIGNMEFKGNLHEYLLGRTAIGLDTCETGLNGWTTDIELATLSSLASKSDSVVEIGCWKGRSTETLLKACKGTVYAVDHWQGTDTDITGAWVCLEDIYSQFMDNVGHYSNLKVMKGCSVDMANKFNGDKVDMVFIDAGHSYEECKADIEAWLPKCRKIICGHDYVDEHPGVMKAVNEKFKDFKLTGSLWYAEVN
jgi:precorrin-6B methylase 2